MCKGLIFAVIYVPWHTFNMANETVSPAVIDLLGDVAELMLAELDEIVDEMNAAEVDMAPALGADAAIAGELSASNRANVARLLTTIARRDGRAVPTDVPPEAMD